MKIVMTFKCEIELEEEDLESYEAQDIHEAAANQAKWIQDGLMEIEDLAPDMELVNAVGVE